MLRLPGLSTFAAIPLQAAPAVPSQVTGSHWVALCPCLCMPGSGLLLCPGVPGGTPGRAKGQSLSLLKCSHGGTDRYPGTPGAHRVVTPMPKHRLPAASLPGSLSPHRSYIFITVAKGDQLHPYNGPLHKTNRPGNWDKPVKYFIVWIEEFVPQLTSCPSPTAQESQCYFSLSSPLSAWEQHEEEHGAPTSVCLLPPRASPDSSSTGLLGASIRITVSFFQGTMTKFCPDSRRFDTINMCPGLGG